MNLKLITCDVLTRLVCHCVARTPHVVDVEFTEKGAHDEPDNLRAIIQQRIDNCERSGRKYDAILLGYGLCGNSVVNITARSTQLVIPRAHDCCTIFLGSKEKYVKYFGDNPSTGFTAVGYMERGDGYVREGSDYKEDKNVAGLNETYQEYVEKYGEDNAKYLWETLHPKDKPWEKDNRIMYIKIPELQHLGYMEKCRRSTEADGKEFVELDGSIELIEKLIFGRWAEEDFLIVKPNQRIAAIYDMHEVIKAK